MAAQSCLARSTAHGLLNIGNERNIYGKILWLMLTLMMSGGFVFHTYLLYNQLKEENVLVTTRLEAVPFIQPDIVFCSERFFARDFINHPPEDEYEYMLNVSKSIQRLNQLYGKTANKSSNLIWDSLDSYNLFKAFFHRRDELFLSIKCNMEDFDLEKLQVEMNFVYFACYRLPSTSCNLTSPLDSLIVKFYTHIHGVNVNYSALNVLIDNKTIDSFVFAEKEVVDEMEDGIHVYLVQPHQGINEDTPKITASTSSHTTIRVKSTQHDRLSTKKTSCKSSMEYSRIYNLLQENITDNPVKVTEDSLCMESLFQFAVYITFKCVIKRFPIPFEILPSFQFCNNLFSNSNDFNYMTYWKKPQVIKAIVKECKVTNLCRSITHSAVVNYNHWPRMSILRYIFKKDIRERLAQSLSKNKSLPGLLEAYNQFTKNPNNLDPWKRNFMKVSIYPAEMMSTVIEESSAYSLKNLFSDIGGIMGFYMGASLLTICEVFRLLHCTIKSIFHKKENKDEPERHSLNEDSA